MVIIGDGLLSDESDVLPTIGSLSIVISCPNAFLAANASGFERMTRVMASKILLENVFKIT
jgi:hypothetical protein